MRTYMFILILLSLPVASMGQVMWEDHIIDAGLEGAFEVCVADVNSDGTLDVIGTAYYGNDVVWYSNLDGSGLEWSPCTIDTAFTGATSPDAADIDGDGDIDIVASADALNEIAWWENLDGMGTSWVKHSIETNLVNAESARAADIDGDGDQDVIGAAWVGDEIKWYENVEGDGQSWIPHNVATGFDGANCAIAADVDLDGDLDILGSASLASELSWWENVDGDGITWSGHVVNAEFTGAYFIHTTDVDLDGYLDVLGAAYQADEIAWWKNVNGDGSLWEKHTVDGNYNGAWSVTAEDIDGDGDIDVLGAAAFADDITWWEDLDGDSQNWVKHTIDGNFNGARCVVATDLDQDGDPDVVGAAQFENSITWWEQVPYPVQLTLTLTSSATIPAEGGTLVYDAHLVSTLPNTYPGVYYWTNVILPDGDIVSPPHQHIFTLLPFMDYTGTGFTQSIPGFAPAGGYEFVGYVGYPGGINISDSFEFMKEGADPGSIDNSWDGRVIWEIAEEIPVELIPTEFRVSGAYPNPFNPSTSITVILPRSADLKVEVFNIVGQQVAVLADGQFTAGLHQLTFNAEGQASGLYLIRATTKDQAAIVQKAMLLK